MEQLTYLYSTIADTGLGYEVMLGACFIYFIVGSLLLMKIKGRS
jgi:hypothetical protein